MTAIREIASRVPLFAGLDADELGYVLRAAQQLEFASGALMARQGQNADTALFLQHGRAQMMNMLPGGGETVVGELGPGSVLGEMALLDSGVRFSNVVAREPTACLSMKREVFHMLIAQGNRTVLAINHRITLALCQRLRELNSKILAVSTPEHLPPALANRTHQRVSCRFDFRAFLGLLPAFRQCSVEEIDGLLQVAQVFELPRGALLFEAGAPSTACYMVLRGALEISREHNGALRRIGILGPGRLCGILAMIEGQPHSMSAVAREDVTLMEVPQLAFQRIYSGEARGARHFQQAINRELLQSLSRTNNHLTRLISQARIRNHLQHADELQRTLLQQDCLMGAQ